MHIRNAHVAGSFYDGDTEKLRAYVQNSLQQAQSQLSQHPQNVHMVMLPHAGHFYCGHIIAETLAQVRLPQTLIVLGPNHTGQGTASSGLAVWHKGQWQSPLGPIAIAEDVARSILDCGAGFEADTVAHAQEHSLEVLMPFLQAYAPQFRMVPICVGNRHVETLQRAGLMLAGLMHQMHSQGQDIALVVSSDMHHFSSHELTLELDRMALQAMEELDPLKLYNTIKKHNISMCGVFPAIMAIYACKHLGAKKCKLVNHTTSYEKSGNNQRTVGYAGLFVPKNTCQKS